jgi:glycerophosphoryl diester phosphodiesterase
MDRIFVFGHRGAMGYCPENTIPSFKKAVEFKVGIETDIRLTKDKKVICFHDPAIKIKNQWIKIKDLTYKELNSIRFENEKKVPLLKDVFKTFSDVKYDLRYSFDIGSKRAGVRLVEIAKKHNVYQQIQINVIFYQHIKFLRTKYPHLKLVFTIPHSIAKLKKRPLKYSKLHDFNVIAINLRRNKHLNENFREVIRNNLECYVWGVNSKLSMKRILKLRYKGKGISAIYTDYPDIMKSLIERSN